MNTAVIVAGGFGSRFGSDVPKQFVEVCGRPIICHTVTPFLEVEEIHRVVVVCHAGYINHVETLFKGEEKITVIAGGKTRFHSCKNAIDFLHGSTTKNVLIHDAARPMVTKEIIKNCIDALKKHKAVTVAVPVRDTIVQVENEVVKSVLPRPELFANQTPQCFDFELIHTSYTNTAHANFTDDVSVVMSQCMVHIVNGDERNIKVTYKDDIKLMELLLM